MKVDGLCVLCVYPQKLSLAKSQSWTWHAQSRGVVDFRSRAGRWEGAQMAAAGLLARGLGLGIKVWQPERLQSQNSNHICQPEFSLEPSLSPSTSSPGSCLWEEP